MYVAFLQTLACLMLRCRNEGGDRNGRRGGCANVELKSQRRPSQSRRESILNCLLMANRGFKTKIKGDRINTISENIRPLRRGYVEYWREINVGGVKTAANDCLKRL